MALDPLIFRKVASNFVAQRSVVETRGSSSDAIEAKANVIAQRISTPKLVPENIKPLPESAQEAEGLEGVDEIETESAEVVVKRFELPSADESGLFTTDFSLDESQVEAVRTMATEQYACLIGAAGSGKTTVQRFFLHKVIYGDAEMGIEPMTVKMLPGKQGLNIALCAFTGIATQVIKQNMPGWLHVGCKTIHSLLEYAPVTTQVVRDGQLKESTIFMPSRHAGNKLDHDLILIDEASMVGLDLWHQLLDACKPGTKIFLVGDLNQLPPTASQSMFAYALSEWHVSELTHIHRQKEEAANKIIDVAHSILMGKEFTFDNAAENHNWRVIGYELDSKPAKAGQQIVAISNALRNRRVHSSVDPEKPLVYDPYRDRIITAGNGYDDTDERAAVQQSVINDALGQLIEPQTDDHPRYVIDAGLSKKRFAVNYRVMATKNESPDIIDRVTNGMVGQIISIEKNPDWTGNHALVGPEKEVDVMRKTQVDAFFEAQGAGKSKDEQLEALNGDFSLESLANFDTSGISAQTKSREGGGPASHKVKVQFVNGAVRTFTNKNAVDSLMLAYASTCHKCQGSQFDTAIIVVHHTVKGQLSREWLYTAVTRAVKRVVFLYTKHGINCCLAKQRIFGRNLKEKIERYRILNEEAAGPMSSKVRIRLSIERS